MNTPNGQVLKSLINDGVKVGISSRGVGNGKVDEEGILVIGESYKLITFDAVADPSTFAAFQEKIVTKEGVVERIKSMSATGEGVVHPRRSGAIKKGSNTALRNESSRIDIDISADALIACLGGVVKSETEQIRSRLN